MGGFAYFSGRWDESISLYTRSRETYLRAGNDVLAAMVGANMGEVLLSQAKLKEAEPILDEAVRVLRAAGNQDDAINAELHLAHLMSERGDSARATDLLRKVRKDAFDLGQTLYAFEAGLYLAACKLQEGDPQGALDGIAEATARGGEEAKFFEAKRARISAAALVEMGRFEEASVELESGLRSALDLGLPHDEALIRVARISLATRTGVEPEVDEVEKTNRLLAQLGIEQAVAVV
jgi:tetratricopeptide (TPR) repeat protein